MDRLKAAFWPAVGGIVVGMLLLTLVFGFVSGGTATEMAEEAAEDATVAALAPLCIANAQADEAGLAEVMAMSSFQRRNAVSDQGWATYPEGASSALTRAIDQACVNGLDG